MRRRERVICLWFTGRPITEEIAEVLFNTAREMHRESRSEQRIRRPNMEGVVTSTGAVYSIGGMGGPVFNVELETDAGTLKVRYLARTRDLESDDEISWDVYYPPTHPSETAHLN